MANASKSLKTDSRTQSTLEVRDDLRILHLRGTPYERGAAHGRLLREEIRDSNIAHYYGDFLLELYRSSDFAARVPGFVRRVFGGLLEWWYYSPLAKLCLPETAEEISGIADEAGLDRREALRAYAAPDIMGHLAAGFLRGGKEALGNYYLGGCTGAYARAGALKRSSGALFGRNMDFPGVFAWKYPCLIFSHPEEEVEVLAEAAGNAAGEPASGDPAFVRKRKPPYLYVSTAGFPGQGLTGMNAAGVAMGTFVCLSKSYRRAGLLTLDFNHYLLTRTESVGGVRHMLGRRPLQCATPHTVVFADEREAAAVEVDGRRHVVRSLSEDCDLLVQTNHYQNPRMKKREIEFPLVTEDTVGRFRLVKDALEAGFGRVDVQRMVDVLSSNFDRAGGDHRLLGDFPAQPITLSSAVFEPGRGRVWVASGRPPAVCYNVYQGFDFHRELNGQISRLPGFQRSSRPLFPGAASGLADAGPRAVTPIMKESLVALMRSQEALKMGRRRSAVHFMQKAAALSPDPGFRYVLALLTLMEGRADEALSQISGLGREARFAPVKRTALVLWEGRCLDLIGRRGEAREVYRRGLEDPGVVDHLRKAFRRGLRAPFRAADLPRSIDYHLMGPLEFT